MSPTGSSVLFVVLGAQKLEFSPLLRVNPHHFRSFLEHFLNVLVNFSFMHLVINPRSLLEKIATRSLEGGGSIGPPVYFRHNSSD